MIVTPARRKQPSRTDVPPGTIRTRTRGQRFQRKRVLVEEREAGPERAGTSRIRNRGESPSSHQGRTTSPPPSSPRRGSSRRSSPLSACRRAGAALPARGDPGPPQRLDRASEIFQTERATAAFFGNSSPAEKLFDAAPRVVAYRDARSAPYIRRTHCRQAALGRPGARLQKFISMSGRYFRCRRRASSPLVGQRRRAESVISPGSRWTPRKSVRGRRARSGQARSSPYPRKRRNPPARSP